MSAEDVLLWYPAKPMRPFRKRDVAAIPYQNLERWTQIDLADCLSRKLEVHPQHAAAALENGEPIPLVAVDPRTLIGSGGWRIRVEAFKERNYPFESVQPIVPQWVGTGEGTLWRNGFAETLSRC